MNVQRLSQEAFATVKELLRSSDLPVDDLTPEHLQHFHGVWESGRLVGVVGLEILGRDGLLRSLAVSSERRGQKLGSALTRAIAAYAQAHGVERFFLLTTTADQFFRRHGYEVVSRDSVPALVCETTEFKSVCPVSAVCMTKALARSSR